MAIDQLIINRSNSLASLINQLAGKELLSLHKILDKESYGYTEFLSHTAKDSVLKLPEMEEYYRSLGCIQAFAQVFGIRDLHQDNMIVHKKRPFLIDLEVAFSLKSLLESQETELIEAILHISRSDQNHVKLDEELSPIPVSQHFTANREMYLKAVYEGFEEMKKVISKNKEPIIFFIESIPNTIRVRFVPIMTSAFQQILKSLSILHQSESFLSTINQAPYITHLKQKKYFAKSGY